MDEGKYKEVPIEAAKEISIKYDKDEIVIVCHDKKHGMTHVTTYGQSKEDSESAALSGNSIKKALGWPDELCNSKPEHKPNKIIVLFNVFDHRNRLLIQSEKIEYEKDMEIPTPGSRFCYDSRVFEVLSVKYRVSIFGLVSDIIITV
jgi:hypothetical protein